MPLPLDGRHQAGISACRRRVDASYALSRETRHVMWATSFGTGAAQSLTAKRLAFDHGADLVTIDVEIPDTGMLLHIIADRVDAALKSERQAIPRGVDVLDHLIELIASEADHVKNRAEILAIQLA